MMSDRRYGVIYADPPWTFATYSRRGKGRSAEAHYDCMSMTDIANLHVGEKWSAKDCALFMWTTDPLLPTAISILECWGFEYKTIGFVWAKTSSRAICPTVRFVDEKWPIGTGYWTRANPEICLLGTRGHPKRQSRAVRKLIVAPRREHSRKPDEIYERIEALVPGPYLELFGRFDREGWDRHGLEDGIGKRRWRSNKGPSDDE